jgi:hypothetical protein
VKCKEMIAGRKLVKKMCGSDLPLKAMRWTEDYAEEIRFLLLSIFFKVDTNRFGSYVAFIMLEENEHGFRVVLAEEVPVTSLPDDVMQDVRKRFSDFSKISSDAHCTVVFRVKAAKNGNTFETATSFGMGEDYILPTLQKFADGLKKDEIIKELNQE